VVSSFNAALASFGLNASFTFLGVKKSSHLPRLFLFISDLLEL
jgi:hypothetical protein